MKLKTLTNHTLRHGTFLTIILAVVFFSVIWFVVSSFYQFVRGEESFQDNTVILQYQLDKINTLNAVGSQDTETIIVGDSSAGHAIDAAVFTELSSQNTQNLALNAAFGLEGTYNMIRHAQNSFPLKNVIIIHTLDLWRREFSERGYLDTLGTLPVEGVASSLLGGASFNITRYDRNFIRIPLFIRLFSPTFIVDDFIGQQPARFSNGQRTLTEKTGILPTIHPAKRSVLTLIDEYCGVNNLRCIYLHAPLHQTLVKQSAGSIGKINSFLASTTKNIIFVDAVFSLHENQLGDSITHTDPSYKKDMTRIYFSKISSLLVK